MGGIIDINPIYDEILVMDVYKVMRVITIIYKMIWLLLLYIR